MPSARGIRGTPIGGRATIDARSRRQREAHNTATAVRGLLADAARGTKMAAAVEQRIAGLGAAQLRAIVMAVWLELAAAQRDPQPKGHP